jgi:parvulin-like peptidyl-prolyl isomerase
MRPSFSGPLMKARYVIAVACLSAQLAGCSWVRKLWPWGKEDSVPVTKPASEDANALGAATQPVAAAAKHPGPTPRPEPTEPVAAAPPPAGRITRPISLTELLHGRKGAPAVATQPAGTTAVVAVRVPPRVATRPAGTPVGRPDMPGGPAREPIGRTILPVGEAPTPVGPERVVAASAIQVNNRFITVDDILRRLRPRLKKVPKTVSLQAFRQRVAPWVDEELRDQINQALVLQEAHKRLTDQQKKVIDAEVQEARNAMLAEAGGSITRLRHTLAKQGTTLEQTLTEHREDAAFRFYLRSRFMPAIAITRKMLWDYYRIHHEEFTAEKRVQMQIIAAPFSKFLPEDVASPSAIERLAARKKAKEAIDKALAALSRGEDFGEVAKRLSRGIKAKDGGIWPLMAAETFRETEVERTAFKLQVGEMAGPIETQTGFYVVKVRRLEPGRVVPFEEAQEKISETLRNRMYLELTEKYFRDLHEKALIRRSEDFQAHVLARAAEEHFRN